MSKKGDKPQSPRHINIYDEDWEHLDKAYGPQSPGKFGISPFLREAIHSIVKRLKQREQDEIDRRRLEGDRDDE